MRSRKFIAGHHFSRSISSASTVLLIAEHRDQNAETDGGFRHRHRDDENREDLAVHMP